MTEIDWYDAAGTATCQSIGDAIHTGINDGTHGPFVNVPQNPAQTDVIRVNGNQVVMIAGPA